MTELSNSELLELTARVVCLWMVFYGTALVVIQDEDEYGRRARRHGARGLGAWLWATAATVFVTMQWLV